MIVFALDSSTASASVAVVKDGETLFLQTTDFGTTHSENLMPLCDKAFKQAGITPWEVDLYAVCNGPGSYTGLRIGVSVIKGLALATGRPTQPVSTLKTLALAQPHGNVVALLNARRGNYFCAAYRIDCDVVSEVVAPGFAHGDEINSFFGGEDIILTGDGAIMFYESASPELKAGLTVSRCNMPQANVAAKIAVEEYNKTGGVTAQQLLPTYIREVHIG